ncbi:hypothetical protein OPS25_08795 [Alteromonas ponticola]|uniref:Uncharacterized protein n=1 Tax=Alteromonas aquimaris TaxID=2998417 RepID=A0ABT3P745_9ALTE|nr:hypothetical protein [Alteromonas aquimaris]MCW8108591.1 hypothetical protein [Alteromonas aquimaris]
MDKSASTRRTIFRIINGFSRKLKSNKNRNITPQSKSKSRGLVERISRKECVGWYIAKDGNSPAPENFILAAEGKNWIESVTLFYRKDLSSINGENNYGFKIKFTGVLPKSATASLFYYRDNTIFHIPPAPAVKSPISKVSPKTLAINRFTAELISIDCEIKKPRLLNGLLSQLGATK